MTKGIAYLILKYGAVAHYKFLYSVLVFLFKGLQ